MLQYLGGVERRIVDDSAPGLENSEQADKIVRRVGEIETNMNPRLNPELLETVGRTVREIVEFSVRDLPAHEIYRWIVRPFRRGFLENLLNGRQWDFGIPPDSWRVRFDPGFIVHEVSSVLVFRGLDRSDPAVDGKSLAGYEGAGIRGE